MAQHHLPTQAHEQEVYSIEAHCHDNINKTLLNPTCAKLLQFAQSYSVTKGLKKFGQQGRDAAAIKEIKQSHDWVVFQPNQK